MRPNTSKGLLGQSGQPYSGLTMNINRATLPSVPFLVQQQIPSTVAEGLSSFIGQDTPEPELAHTVTSSSASLPPGAPLPPTEPVPSSQGPPTRPGPRSRYVLPPGLQTTHSTAEPIVPNLPPVTQLPAVEPQMFPGLPQPSEQNRPVAPTVTQPESSPYPVSYAESQDYQPVTAVWFYATIVNHSRIWWPFSRSDNSRIEAQASGTLSTSPSSSETLLTADEFKDDIVVPVEGGRYDVYVNQRERHAVYWDEPVTEVRRATWFYRSPNEARVLPFSERMADLLEVQYKRSLEKNLWGQRFELPSEDPRGGTDYFIFHSPQSMIQHRAWPYSCIAVADAVDTTKQPPSAPEDAYPKAVSALTETDVDSRICFVRRGLDDQLMQQLEEGEVLPVDHVYFVVHGIGSVYNLKGEGLVECVDGLRRTARKISQSHFPHHRGRAEFLPIMWHDSLHSDATGVDEQLHQITLRSIPKLRQFTNGTLTDILFYTSSKYCQVIVDTVAKDICRLREMFLLRNPNYKGGFSIIGHSLGAVIVFDLLAHQRASSQEEPTEDKVEITEAASEDIALPDQDRPSGDRAHEETDKSEQSSSTGGENEGWSLVGHEDNGKHSSSDVENTGTAVDTGKWENSAEVKRLMELLIQTGLTENQTSQVINTWLTEKTKQTHDKGANRADSNTTPLPHRSFWLEGSDQSPALAAGFGMPVVSYPQLGFPVTAFFMLGSPLPLFLTARGIKQLSSEYRLPTCPMFFNVFHPFDPVAYRMETLVDSNFQPRAVLMPHHKGRKRLHLQLRDNLARVGADLKAKLYQSVQSTWKSLQDFAASHGFFANQTAEGVDHGNGDDDESNVFKQLLSRLDHQPGERDDVDYPVSEAELSFPSQLNEGRRLDFVLQEAPLESFSDYLFALGSHAAYWESEDTALFLLSEVYSLQSVIPVGPGQKALESASTIGESSFIPTTSTLSVPQPFPSSSHGSAPPSSILSAPTGSFSAAPSSTYSTLQSNVSANAPLIFSSLSTAGPTPSTLAYSYSSNHPPAAPSTQPVATTVMEASPPVPPLPPSLGQLPQASKDVQPLSFRAYQHHKPRTVAVRPPQPLAPIYQPSVSPGMSSPSLSSGPVVSQLLQPHGSDNPVFNPPSVPHQVFPTGSVPNVDHQNPAATAYFTTAANSTFPTTQSFTPLSSTSMLPPSTLPGR